MVNSPIRFMALSSSACTGSPLRCLSEASIPPIAFSRHCSRPEDLYAQLARQKLHRLVTQKPQNDLTLARHRGAADVAGIDHRAGEFQHYLDSGYNFPALVHPHAWIGREVTIGAGAQVMAGAIVQPYGEIGRNVILNSGALIDHHSRIEDHAHIAPGAVLCGNVTIGKGAMVGAGAVILPGATVPAGELVKAASRYPK